jgi:hypothetical protein
VVSLLAWHFVSQPKGLLRLLCGKPANSFVALQNHGAECTEEFYRDQIRGELGVVEREDVGKGALLRNLARLGLGSTTESDAISSGEIGDGADADDDAADSDDSERAAPESGASERISHLKSIASAGGVPITLDALTPEERAMFSADVSAGRVVPPGSAEWRPWWCVPEAVHVAAARKMVAAPSIVVIDAAVATPAAFAAGHDAAQLQNASLQQGNVVDETDATPADCCENDVLSDLVYSPQTLPCVISTAHSTRPVYLHGPASSAIPRLERQQRVSPQLCFMVTEVLCAYALVHRRYLGECVECDPVAACSDLLAASAALLHDRRYSSLQEALIASAEAFQSASVRTSARGRLSDALLPLRDVVTLLSCIHYVTDALFDARAIVQAALAAVRKTRRVAAAGAGHRPQVTYGLATAAVIANSGSSPTSVPQTAEVASRALAQDDPQLRCTTLRSPEAAAAKAPLERRAAGGSTRSSSSGSRLMALVAAERKLLFYCSWAATTLDPLALSPLRQGVIEWAREVAPSWSPQSQQTSKGSLLLPHQVA